MRGRIPAAALAMSLLPVAAAAQSTPAPGGPMIVERVKSSFIFAPEVKVTRFDRRTSELVGGYAGRLTDQTFFIGGGGYWMATRSRDRQLAYGGVVLGLMAHADRRVGYGVKGLVGGGRATSVRSITLFDDRDRDDVRILGTVAPNVVLPKPIATNVRVREAFFVVEPEANVLLKLGRRVRLTAGAGYRWVGRERRGRESLSGFSGATGSIGLQIGG